MKHSKGGVEVIMSKFKSPKNVITLLNVHKIRDAYLQ